MSSTSHYFNSTMRRGWAALIGDIGAQKQKRRAEVNVSLRATARDKTTRDQDEALIEQQVQLFGPGDILGFRPEIVSATTPKADVGDFEPNYFPAIEFADWDFAWRFTAKPPADEAGLTPWIALIVLVAESRGEKVRPEFVDIASTGTNLPRRIKLADDLADDVDGPLPNLEYAHYWAHAQLTSEADLSDTDVLEIFRTEPERGIGRLLCPRRLKPGVRYAAFVVPTFKLGWLAGMGFDFGEETALDLAWDGNGAAGLELPYYYRWEFRTGLRGDFEHLVRLLEPRELTGLGTRDVDCSAPGLGVPGVTIPEGKLGLEGALRSVEPNFEFTQWGADGDGRAADTQTALADLINQTDDLLAPVQTGIDEPWFQIEPATGGVLDIDDIDVELLNTGDGIRARWRTSESAVSCLFYSHGGVEYCAYSEPGHPWPEITATAHIRDIAVTPLEPGTAVTVTWRTTLPAKRTYLAYIDAAGLRQEVDAQSTDATSRHHWVTVTGLTVGGRYRAQIVAELLDGTREETNMGQFHLPRPSQDHRLTLRGLTPGRRYNVQIRARSGTDVVVTSVDPKAGWFALAPAVVPPIYGRWHRARDGGVDPGSQSPANKSEWIDQLNLDPRHRMAAGLGSEVIRKQQEALMASAWDQLGQIDEANDVLRRAQAGREATTAVYRRLDAMRAEDFLQVTAPVHKRVRIESGSGPGKVTAAHVLKTETRIPAAALEPAFRHIARRRGPIRRRQRRPVRGDLLTRLATGTLEAAGQIREPLGMVRICDISDRLQNSFEPKVELSIVGGDLTNLDPISVGLGGKVLLFWTSENAINCQASGPDWSGPRPPVSSSPESVTPFSAEKATSATYALTCNGLSGSASDSVTVYRKDDVDVPLFDDSSGQGSPTSPLGTALSTSMSSGGAPVTGTSVMRSALTPQRTSTVRRRSLEVASGTVPPGVRPVTVRPAVVRGEKLPLAPVATTGIFKPGGVAGGHGGGSTQVSAAERARRFCDGKITPELIDRSLAEDDPFGPIAGGFNPADAVEAIKTTLQNWLDAAPSTPDLPPIQEDTFVAEFKNRVLVKLDPEATVLARARKRLSLGGTLNTRFKDGFRGDPLDSIMWSPEFKQPMYEPLRDMSHSLLLPGVEKIPQNTLGILSENRRFIESYHCGLCHSMADEFLWREFPTDQRGSYFRQFWDVRSYTNLKDITPITEWGGRALGTNKPETVGNLSAAATGASPDGANGNLVLVIRGDLLKRYPNAAIYVIDGAIAPDGRRVPKLAEYLNDPSFGMDKAVKPSLPHFPVFKATLPPDLTFLVFPFPATSVRAASAAEAGKFIVIEEPLGEPRFGLDVPSAAALNTWSDLSWKHVGLEKDEDYGKYLDEAIDFGGPSDPSPTNIAEWKGTTSAQRARITFQRPVRIVVHANQMLP